MSFGKNLAPLALPRSSRYNSRSGGVSRRQVKFGIVRKFLSLLLPCTTRFVGLGVKKNSVKTLRLRKGALCTELAEFRCEVEPSSLSCVFAHGSLVVQREILLAIT